ncbi:MAG: EF-hand domain-containing protein [Gemmataceae bacterium]|nr:EF-hand domain-containing protein [Gemmataceae bacterium]
MTFRVPALVLSLAVAWSLAGAQQPTQKEQPRPRAEPYDVVFLSKSRPLVLRLDVRMDGKPLQAAWDSFIDYLFKYADSNGDGVLSKDEAEGAPQPNLLSPNFLFGGFFGGMPSGGGNMDSNGDGKVTREEFAAFYRRPVPPFTVSVETPGRGGPGMGMPYQNLSPKPNDLNKALTKLLDTNKDGNLSRQELEAAPALFHKLDLDEDEVITYKELMPGFSNMGLNFAVAVGGGMGKKEPNNNDPVFLAPAGSSRSVTQRILAHYGKGKKVLTQAELGLDADSFARLDRDSNGELDGEELARFTQRQPDLECIIRIGERRDGEPIVEVSGNKEKARAGGIEVRTSPEGVVLVFGKHRLALRVTEGKPRSQLGFILRQGFMQQFSQADMDNNGYLDEKEGSRGAFGRGLFKMIDRDGDGKIYEKEVGAWLDTVEDLQTRATVACASLSFADGGQGLFELFDTDRDTQLSLREIKRLPLIVDELDRNKDGQLSPDEIPHSYLFKMEQGSGGGGANPFIFLEAFGMQSGPRPPTGRGPVWFQRMDRNRDGDVSRGEFLGSESVFRQIDSDGDGLISAEEATRFEQRLKKDRAPKR